MYNLMQQYNIFFRVKPQSLYTYCKVGIPIKLGAFKSDSAAVGIKYEIICHYKSIKILMGNYELMRFDEIAQV